MKVQKFNDRDAWMLARRGKITGSKLGDVLAKKNGDKKIGFYALIAERLATEPDGEYPMERGLRLESEALERFAKESGKKVVNELVIWEREDNPSIALSPDGMIGISSAVEVKCLSSERHIEAWLKHEIPGEYQYQVLQYFAVNDNLKTLYFVFYDPRLPAKDFFYIEVKRKDVAEEIKDLLETEKMILEEVDTIVNELSGF